MLGYHPEELIGRPFTITVPPSERDDIVYRYKAHAAQHVDARDEYTLVGHDSRTLTVLATTIPLDTPGSRRMRATFVVDITERRHVTEMLEYQARHDSLTGLPNRAYLHDYLEHTLRQARPDTPVTLFLIDLDHFKDINDTLGHRYGDLVLQEVARRMQQTLRAVDLVARLGGDEFAVVLPGTDADGAVLVARRILDALHDPVVVDGQPLSISASIGSALYPAHGQDSTTLLRHADIAMYAVKRRGGGYLLYDQAHNTHSLQRLSLMGELRAAIETGGLEVYYQPQLSLARGGRLRGVEALIRWRHPDHGLIPPDQFIPLAEQSGLIAPLTYWVLRTAVRQAYRWQQMGLQLEVAVNLSPRSLYDPALYDAVTAALKEYPIAAHRLTLEITENAIVNTSAQALDGLVRLKEVGVRLSIDDFGTGYSSLGYLKHLPVHEIKVDKAFVQGMATDNRDAALVHSIIALGHDLGLRVVAEGVEDRPTWNLLRGLGCDTAQGYYVSRPLPARDFEHWQRTSPWGRH